MSDTPPKVEPARRPRRRGWRIFFAVFKWCRVAALLLVLGLVLALIFLNQAGLPVSLQERLVARFRELGWDAQFSNLRLRWHRGIVAEQLTLSSTNTAGRPTLFIESAEFRLNPRALRSLQLQIDAMRLSDARLVWLSPATDRPRHTFVLDRIHGEFVIHPDNRWDLRSLECHTLGVHLQLRGDITNAHLVRTWKLPRPDLKEPPETPHAFWSDVLARAKQFRPVVTPRLSVQFTADGRDPGSLDATVKLFAPGLDSPWGAATNLNLVARLQPAPATNAPMRAELKLSADHPRTPWGAASQLVLSGTWEPSLRQLLPTNSQFMLELRQPRWPWGSSEQLRLEARTAPSTNGTSETLFVLDARQPAARSSQARHARLTVRAVHPATRPLPAQLRLEAELDQVSSPWVTSRWARAEGAFALPAPREFQLFRTGATWPERGANIEASLALVLTNALARDVILSQVTLTNHWKASQLRVGATLDSPAGALAFNAALDPATRAARINSTLRIDPPQLARFLPTNAQAWLAEYHAPAQPELQIAASVTLPPWTNAAPDWRRDILPGLSIASRAESGAGTFRLVSFTGARAIGLFTNGQWTLPEMRVTRPEGALEAEAFADTRTADFRVRFNSSILPDGLRPAFDERVHRQVFDPFSFTVPPLVRGEVRGNWRNWTTLSASGDAAITNAAVRTQAIAFASARVEFTNRFLSLLQPLVLRDGERGEAEGVGLDTRTLRLYLTNAHGTIDPKALAHAIGPPVVKVLEPYVFDTPPKVRAHGLLPLRRGDHGEDAWFDAEGGPFHWQRFHADSVRARIHWLGESKTVTLTNLTARWRGADVAGWMQLDFSRPQGGGMAFHAALEGADLSAVVRDLQDGRSNRLEGTFGGELNVTEAFLDDLRSWQGHGRVELREGLLWDAPLFALISPMLNRVIPGLGHSRAREGKATFTITNSVIHSRDLEVRASAMQLKYRGTIDFHARLDARMEAELFRNIPGLGLVLSKVLWPVTKLFEYRVTGTLDNPKLDEMYFIPKVVLFPLQPIKTLKDIFGTDKPRPDPPDAPTPTPAPAPAPAPPP